MGCRFWADSETGMVGEVIGCQDQCSFFLLAKLNDDLSALEEKLGTGSSGQTAPSLIHFSRSEITS